MKPFTTSEVSRLLGISLGAVQRLIDSGQLEGMRIHARRLVHPESLLAFARVHNLHRLVKQLVIAGAGVVLLSDTPDVLRSVECAADVLAVRGWYEAVEALLHGRPRGFVVDLALGRDDCLRATEKIRAEADRPTLVVIAYGDTGSGPWDHAVLCPDELFKLPEIVKGCVRR